KESLDKSFIEEVCAFANSSGGKVILRVSDKGVIKGINTDNNFRSRVQDSLRQLQPYLNVGVEIFDKSANVLIEVFDDRVEISNPGGLPSGLKPSDFGRKSVARNPLIASLLNRINYIEKIGTGINRIKQADGFCHKTSARSFLS
ncbi:MAG: putative DNA binding domain-containing protein, partial [Dehalobacter sp.]|nr:putative DNA binding domain-containing protein [Dehalobacter sp.]